MPPRRAIAAAAACFLLLSSASCTVRRGGGGDDDDNGGGGNDGAAVAGLTVVAVSINQGVDILLMEDGDEITGTEAPIISGRRALFRVHVDRSDSWVDRDVKAVVHLYEGDDQVATFEDISQVDEDSDIDDLGSTLNVDVPAEEITNDTRYSVSLHEAEEGDWSGSTSGSRWPAEGNVDLDARTNGAPLRIALVPVQYNYDGSGRLPETGEPQLQRYHDWIKRLYPAGEVDIDLQPAVAWNSEISPYGNGWSDLLNALMGYRDSENFDEDVYVYGIFAPDVSYSSFCSQGCVAGLSIRVESASDAWGRVSIGVGFTGEDAAETMAHEVGHAHGREHAPCGLGGQPSDSGYPHSGATLGNPGWDVVDGGGLVSANNNYDIMSYCPPSWVSDYTYDALFDRMTAVTALASVVGAGDPTIWQTAIVEPDGSLRRGASSLELLLPPNGQPRTIEFFDGDGLLVDVQEARFAPFDHLGGGLLLVPEAPSWVTSARLEGGQPTAW